MFRNLQFGIHAVDEITFAQRGVDPFIALQGVRGSAELGRKSQGRWRAGMNTREILSYTD